MSMIRRFNFIMESQSNTPNNLHVNNRVPIEILTEIFLFCIPDDPLNHRQPDTTIAPMLLCQVCSYWRRVALNTPVLWVYLYHACKISDKIIKHELKTCYRSVDVQFLAWWTRILRNTPLVFRFDISRSKMVPYQPLVEKRIMEETQVDPGELFFHIITNARGLYLNDFASVAVKEQFGLNKLNNLQCRNLRSLASQMELPKHLLNITALPSITLRHLTSVTRTIYQPLMVDGGIPLSTFLLQF